MDTSEPEVTVIVPTLNEAAVLPTLLAQLSAQRGVALEVIVADGGSDDDSVAVARAAGATALQCAKANRGAQMNAAAERARGALLLFLHADTRLPDEATLASAVDALWRARRQGEEVAGHFALRFYDRGSGEPLRYRYLEEKTALNRPNTTNGDQGFLMSRALFERLGGFDASLPFLEDQRLAERLRRAHRWMTLPGHIETSARRFEAQGFGRTYTLMALVMACFDARVDRFFELAPAVYRHQGELTRLEVAPFMGLVGRVLGDLGPWGSLVAWYRVGRFVRRNIWQLWLLGDVIARPCVGRGRYPLLGFYDRALAEPLDHPVFDALAGGLAAAAMVVVAGWFALEERALGGD